MRSPGPLRNSARLIRLLFLVPAVAGGAELRFTDVTAAAGVDFRHRTGFDGSYWFPEIVSGGVGIADLDGDGRPDLILIDGGKLPEPAGARHVVFGNLGSGRFARRAELEGAAYGQGCAVGDADGDGDPDLYVTNVGPNQLFRNDGGFSFVDVSRQAGVAGEAWSSSAEFADLDGDGDLDLFVANYCQWSPAAQKPCRSARGEPDYCHPSAYPPAPDTFWRNRGDGTFEDATAELGLHAAYGRGLGVAIADFDGDGRPDVFVANDGDPNVLWLRDEEGHFHDGALLAGVAFNGVGMAEASMGVAVADVGRDGRFDILLAHMTGETNTFLRNDGGSFFVDATDAVGLGRPSVPWTGFGTGFVDFDLDGDDDLLVVNGAVVRGEAEGAWPYGQTDLLFVNEGEGFRALPEAESGLGPPAVGRGAAFGDLDGDGDEDALVGNAGEAPRLLRNDAAPPGAWLGITLGQDGPNREGIGAVVEAAAAGEPPLARRVTRGGSFASARAARVTFGWRDAPREVRVGVRWPDGARESWTIRELDRSVTLLRGTGGRSEQAGLVREVVAAAPAEAPEEVRLSFEHTPRAAPAIPDLTEVDEGVERRVRDAWTALSRDPASGAAWKDWGIALYADVEAFAAAAQSLLRAVELAPGDARATYLLALASEHIGDETTRRAALERARELAPGYPPAALRLAQMELEAGRAESAARLAEPWTEGPSAADAWILLARASRARGRPADALADAQRALALVPDSRRAWWELGLARRAAGDTRGAAEALQRAEGLPGDGLDDPWLDELFAGRGGDAGLLTSGHQARRAGNLTRARALYEEYARRQPADAVGWTNVAAVRRDLGDEEGALEAVRRSIELDPARAETRALQGALLAAAGQAPAALTALDEALERDPGLAAAWADRAAVLEALGRRPEAITAQERYVVLSPGDADGWVRLAEMRLRAGQAERAGSDLQRALAVRPDHPVANFRAGGLALRAGDPAEAEACFRRAITARPQWAEAHFGAGLASRMAGREDDARADFRHAVELAPGNPRFRAALDELGG